MILYFLLFYFWSWPRILNYSAPFSLVRILQMIYYNLYQLPGIDWIIILYLVSGMGSIVVTGQPARRESWAASCLLSGPRTAETDHCLWVGQLPLKIFVCQICYYLFCFLSESSMSSPGEVRTWAWLNLKVSTCHCCGTQVFVIAPRSHWATPEVTSVLWSHRSLSLHVSEPEVELSYLRQMARAVSSLPSFHLWQKTGKMA